ncbi:Transcription elongation factor SPT4 [Halocaridina rubra]|uniref:Transcription elongation factor SPT4 n=1 Tax=Halocaridina rubra TaxID=373956 RepID=A0AAN8WKX3_HALRR
MDNIPRDLRGLRACLVCSLVKTLDMFEMDGCDNCDEFLHMKHNRDQVYDCTSSNFDGFIALMSPEDSWVAKWQRINRCVRGMYAISITGRLPASVIRDMKSRGINQYLLSGGWRSSNINALSNKTHNASFGVTIITSGTMVYQRIASGSYIEPGHRQIITGSSTRHFYDPACNYVTIANSGHRKFSFNVPIDGCGTTGQLEMATKDRDMYFENTIIIQNDALIQEEWDIARNIRCTWQHTIQKSVRSTPFKVYEPMKVPVQLDKRSINTLMEIQRGAGPFSSPATGYVYMGDDTSVVIYVQDSSHQMDANVISCNASSAGGKMVELLDSRGCVMRPDLITQFAKTRETNGVQADMMLYSYLKAFRIGESPEFIIACHLEVCEGKCTPPCDGGPSPFRRKRQAEDTATKPKAVFELQRGVVVMSREPLLGNQECWFSTTMLIGISTLICIILCLSTLACFLVFQIKNLRYQLREKQPL